MTPDTQTAMLLTQQEWDDLTDMVKHYRMCTEWADHHPDRVKEARAHSTTQMDRIERSRALAARIIDANAP